MKAATFVILLIASVSAAAPTTRPARPSEGLTALYQSLTRHVGELEAGYADTLGKFTASTDGWRKLVATTRAEGDAKVAAVQKKLDKYQRNWGVIAVLWCEKWVARIAIVTALIYTLGIVGGFFGPATFMYRLSQIVVRAVPLGGLIRVFHRPTIPVAAEAIVVPSATDATVSAGA